MAVRNQVKRIGLFEVLDEISWGGMARIFRVAIDGREYALKISRSANSEEQTRINNVAIRKEAELLRKLRHRRIVRIYPIPAYDQIGKKTYCARAQEYQPASWYFVMEYLRGGVLEDHVKKWGPLTVPEAANIGGNIILALCELHRKNYTHNDVSARNILFRVPVEKGKPFDPVLIDFGAAVGVKQFEDEAGAWYIMSPERIRMAEGLDPPEKITRLDPTKYDVWSVGVILYYMLTKRYPFSSMRRKRLTDQILHDTPPSIRKINPGVPAEVEEFIVDGCLCKEPKARPNVEDIGRFLKNYGGGRVKAVNAPA